MLEAKTKTTKLLTLKSRVSVVNFEQINAKWENCLILALSVKSFKGNYFIYCLNSYAKVLLQNKISIENP